MQRPRRGQRRKRSKDGYYINYKDCTCAFDIEATNDMEIMQAYMYIWQFAIKTSEGINVIYGRTWQEFRDFIENTISANLSEHERIIIFVHNLSYEWQYLKSVLDFDPEGVFAMDDRKVLYARYGKIEFRCSYMQTNLSLDSLTKKFNVDHQKLSGTEYDYKKIRTPLTELSERELQYCINDVVGLVEAMEKRIDGETYHTLPYTSTGYVRREVKKSMYKVRPWLINIQPDLETYELLLEAFRGGNTHANRKYTGKIITNVISIDKSSAYPSAQVMYLFPVSRFLKDDILTIDHLIELIEKRKRACLFRIRFWNLSANEDVYFPYISRHKCRNVIGCIEDNGRVLFTQYCETTLTDIDFKIIMDQYTFTDVEITCLYSARYGTLPEAYRNIVKKYYQLKTELKGIPEKEEEYHKSKEKLNAIYGMSVMKPTKELLLYDPVLKLFYEDDKGIEELLKKYIEKPYQSYAWGVWTTAIARRELQRMIDACGECALYCDTDSVKYSLDIYKERKTENEIEKIESDIRRRIGRYNTDCYKLASDTGGTAYDTAGTEHSLGIFEDDGAYTRFVTLGAKKYAYEDETGLHVTCSGVNKKLAPKELGKLENFKEGFIFHDAGGTESVYNDTYTGFIKRHGADIEVPTNVLIRDSTYEIGITGDYKWLLKHADTWKLLDD